MSPYTAARCQMPAANCPRLATVEFPAGRLLCEPHVRALVAMGMDDRRPRTVGQWDRRGTAA